ncbi:MAG TPA: DUF3857 domain-containing transglutaminase family protein [Flavisolibacter sp.]|jgi:transglutaminase-like putative cysteine protease|nr:DUF3857 domain-containing transglutaminase family protein [Flavisolibacter sp.]
MRVNCFAALWLVLLSVEGFAAGKKPTIEKLPSWISVTTVNYTASQMDDEAEDGYSDLHFEKQVSLLQQAVFLKKAVHILTDAGVQNQSQIAVDFDPSYQSLIFHTVRVVRNGKVIDKLQLSKIKTIQQEKDLDRNLYDGSLSSVIILDDIRKEDIIEYSYTLKGFNPIFKNKYSALLETGFGVPVYTVFYRLLVPKERQVTVKNNLTDIKPSVSSTATENVYEWKLSNAEAIRVEDNKPSWYDPYPMIMVSEFDSWAEVTAWASELFPFSLPLPDGLQKKVAEIKARHATQEAQVLAAMRFVQDDVRYMGIEMGVNSHKPHAPAQILAQRFGDCKDKAYLLCTLLKALGIEAYPVLNNTYFIKTICSWLPMPTIFDHVTVCIQWKNKTVWIDPTIAYQRGPLAGRSYPNYQAGLVIKQGTTGLTIIPLQESGKISTREIFTVKRLNGKVKLEVITDFSGSFADDIRYSFHNTSLTELRKDFKSFYTGYYNKLTMDSLAHSDNDTTGIFSTREYYTIGDFWEEEDGKTKAFLQPFLINNALKKPAEERTMPYAIRYPLRYHEEIEIRLPRDWAIEEFSSSVKNSAFALKYRYTNPESDVALLTYDYESLSDHIPPGKMEGFVKDLSEINETCGFVLYADGSESSASAFDFTRSNGFTAAYVLLGICALVTYFYKKNNRPGEYGR